MKQQETFIHYNKDCDSITFILCKFLLCRKPLSIIIRIATLCFKISSGDFSLLQETFIHYNKDCDFFILKTNPMKKLSQETFIHYNKDCDYLYFNMLHIHLTLQETFIHYNKDCDLERVKSGNFDSPKQETFIHYNKDCDGNTTSEYVVFERRKPLSIIIRIATSS